MIDLAAPQQVQAGANAILPSPGHARAAANALLSASTAIWRRLRQAPALALMNILNGGPTPPTTWTARSSYLPVGGQKFREALAWEPRSSALKRVLGERRWSPAGATRAASPPTSRADDEAVQLILSAIEKAGYVPGEDVAIALDAAASELYREGAYVFHKSDQSRRSAAEMVDFYEGWVEKYPIVSIEDGLAEDDWEGWRLLTERLGDRVQLVGDDLFVTNTDRLAKGIEEGVANSILIKLNQIGTVTETLACIDLAKRNAYTQVVSHRSGETEDTFIADLAVATGFAARSRPAPSAARSGWPSTTDCCASRRSWRNPPAWPSTSREPAGCRKRQKTMRELVRAGHLRRFALAGLAAAFLSVAGCAYTTVTVTSPKPKLGPLVSTGLAAALPPVKDTPQRPGLARDPPIAEVRIFEPQIPQTLREGLVKNHLFAALPAPSQPEAAELTDRLDVVLTAFRMDKVNTNLWVVPHLILDGVALPAFAATTVVSKGQVDMGGYLLPSTAMGVTLQAKVFLFGEKNLKVMERPYLVELPLGSVSERELRESLRSSAGYGVRLGREEGQKVLAKFVETVSRDPYWAYVEDFRQLAEAEALVASREAPMVEKMAAARRVLRLLKPLIYTPEKAASSGMAPQGRGAHQGGQRHPRPAAGSGSQGPASGASGRRRRHLRLFDDRGVAAAWWKAPWPSGCWPWPAS